MDYTSEIKLDQRQEGKLHLKIAFYVWLHLHADDMAKTLLQRTPFSSYMFKKGNTKNIN